MVHPFRRGEGRHVAAGSPPDTVEVGGKVDMEEGAYGIHPVRMVGQDGIPAVTDAD